MNQNPNDEIKEVILRLLYSIYEKARGIKRTCIGMREMKQALKNQGYKEQEIVSNLDYLTQTNCVLKEEEEYPLRRGGVTINVKNTTYKISEKGINHFQGVSKFQTVHKFENINIMNIKGVTIVGENNVIYNQHTELFRFLDLLDTEIQKAPN